MAKDKTLMYIPKWLVCVNHTFNVSIRESTLKPTKQKIQKTLSIVDEQQTSMKNLANTLSDMLTIPNQVLTGMYVRHVIDDTVIVSHASWGEASMGISSAAYHKLVENGTLDQQELIVVVNKGVEVCLAFNSEVQTQGVPSSDSLLVLRDALTPGLTYKSATREDVYLCLGVSRFTGKTLFVAESSPSSETDEDSVVPYEAINTEPVFTSKLEALKARNFVSRGSPEEVQSALQKGLLKTITLKQLLTHENFYWGVFKNNEKLIVMVDTTGIDLSELVASIIWNHPVFQKELTFHKYKYDDSQTFIDNFIKFLICLGGPPPFIYKSHASPWYLPITLSSESRSLLRKLDVFDKNHCKKSKEGYVPLITRFVFDKNLTIEPYYVAGPTCDAIGGQVLYDPTYISEYPARRKFNFNFFHNLPCLVAELSQGELVTPTPDYLLKALGTSRNAN